MKTIRLPKGYKLGKAIEINSEYNPDVGPTKWIKWDKNWENWCIHDPTPIVGEVCVGKPACNLWIHHDPEYGLLPSVKFGKALRKYAKCENCGASPTTDFGLCPCGSVCGSPFGNASVYRVSFAVWESKLKSLWREELHRIKQTKRHLRKQLSRLEGKTPFTSEDIEKLKSVQNNTCYYCGTSISEGFHIEHLTPLANGGGNDIDNIMLACPPCNQDKGVSDEVVYWRRLQKQLPLQEFRCRRESARVMKKNKRHRFRKPTLVE